MPRPKRKDNPQGGSGRSIEKATLADGKTVEFELVSDPPEGGMKKTYFSPDRAYVVQFYKDQSAAVDPQRLARLDAIVGKYNPTILKSAGGNAPTFASAEYFSKLFCWPMGIVVNPALGIIAPTYPSNYFFASGPFQGKEKQGLWFLGPKVRKLLPEAERGSWIDYFKLTILMARAVRRLHMAGLAHSDLSPKNVLVDPSLGLSVVIDIDSLVVPDLYPPDVLGTPGFIAPEVLATQHLPLNDPNRYFPSTTTDQHALAVLIYYYLLLRHPLQGPKQHSLVSAEEDERLAMGSQALFIEHPSDHSNRPQNLQLSYTVLGHHLSDLFKRAFVDGLHAPRKRPAASEWERGLVKTWDMLMPCTNPGCSHHWFVLDPHKPGCPFCGSKLSAPIPMLTLRSERRPGQWMRVGELVIYNNISLFKWHAFDSVFPGEEADRTPLAYCVFHQGRWLLVNQQLTSLTSARGNRVPIGQALELKNREQIRFSQEPHGMIAEVHMVQT
ncbi:MAG: serine/threonine protein kinase [Candidatus Competibacteraceae bacterium]